MSRTTHRIEGAQAGRMLDAVVRELCGQSWGKARELVQRGKVRVDGALVTEITHKLAAGSEVVIDPVARRTRARELPAEAILYVDADLVVVNKPAGLMTVPYEDERDTLVDRVQLLLRRGVGGTRSQRSELGVVQRLDKDTTGVLVFARTLASKRSLQQQFRVHSIERRYLAIVHGDLATAVTRDSLLVHDRGDGLKGSFGHFRRPRAEPPRDAQRAITYVAPLERLRGATLVECRLQTGRQHQIRIHLSEHGHPLLGEQVYIRNYAPPRIEATRPMLHAAVLGLTHPRTGIPLRLTVDPPADFARMLARLRGPTGTAAAG